MMDHYDEKRGVLKHLLQMLKEHASNEVSNGLKKPEGMPEDSTKGIQVEKVMVADHDMDHPTPEHDVETKELAKGGMAGYEKGGVVEDVSEGGYRDAPEKATPYESAEGHPDKEGSAHEEATESDEEREAEGDITPMFETFFGKKRKK